MPESPASQDRSSRALCPLYVPSLPCCCRLQKWAAPLSAAPRASDEKLPGLGMDCADSSASGHGGTLGLGTSLRYKALQGGLLPALDMQHGIPTPRSPDLGASASLDALLSSSPRPEGCAPTAGACSTHMLGASLHGRPGLPGTACPACANAAREACYMGRAGRSCHASWHLLACSLHRLTSGCGPQGQQRQQGEKVAAATFPAPSQSPAAWQTAAIKAEEPRCLQGSLACEQLQIPAFTVFQLQG